MEEGDGEGEEEEEGVPQMTAVDIFGEAMRQKV